MDKEKYQLSMTAFEISDLSNLFVTKMSKRTNVPKDYGTGEMYTSVEAHTVVNIYKTPGITAKDIAERTARTQSAVSQIISKLVSKGLVKEEKNPDDNRKTYLYVTEKGKELAELHMKYDHDLVASTIDEIVERYGVEAMENYIKILRFFTLNEEW
ncbi:MAG: winged helix-turn-helix transcriptional regulator [Oscillospiraceae bacterium]|nr:winged helix-turn-helix transcriptional regulator [Oscillospiraceae bacterium]